MTNDKELWDAEARRKGTFGIVLSATALAIVVLAGLLTVYTWRLRSAVIFQDSSGVSIAYFATDWETTVFKPVVFLHSRIHLASLEELAVSLDFPADDTLSPLVTPAIFDEAELRELIEMDVRKPK